MQRLLNIATGLLAFCICAAALHGQTTGSLKITSFPAGANITIDGAAVNKVTPATISLAVGDHNVVISIPGNTWNPDTRTVTVIAGNNDLSVTLLPILPAGPRGDQGPQGPKGDQASGRRDLPLD